MKVNPRVTFGWNGDVWNRAFTDSTEVQKILARKSLKILEIGAGNYSQVAYVFDETESNITIGYYAKSIKNLVNKNIKTFDLVSHYDVAYVDALNFSGKYDVVILKSVLGGIFRGDDFAKAEEFCQKVVRDNINSNGALITIDNGKSVLEIILKNFGARKDNWHFTTMDELRSADEKTGFGFISAFAISTRLGSVGFKLEKILYYLDLLLCSFIKSKPTVICSIFLKH